MPAGDTLRCVSPAGNRCHFVLLNKDESCPTADLSNIGRPNGPAYSTRELLNTHLMTALSSPGPIIITGPHVRVNVRKRNVCLVAITRRLLLLLRINWMIRLSFGLSSTYVSCSSNSRAFQQVPRSRCCSCLCDYSSELLTVHIRLRHLRRLTSTDNGCLWVSDSNVAVA